MLLLVLAGSSYAQTGTGVTFKTVLDGGQNQLVANAEATVQDSIYFDAALQSSLDTPYPVRNIVTFRINEYANIYLPAAFNVTLNVRITYTLPDLTTASIDKSLVINYDTAASYKAIDGFTFNNAHRVTVKVLDVTSDAGTGLLAALLLENEIQAQPVYILSCSDDAVKTVWSDDPPNTDSTDEIKVNWTAITGADEYDLEWAYIDSSAFLNERYGNPVDPQLVFENNATRVTVQNNAYSIPLLYDNGGVLYFRVRAVQQKGAARVETAWSSGFSGGLGSYHFCGHQRNLNWQSAISFAEEGKRKVVVQYYDGSLRSRQTVTKDNTTDTTLVSETYYDYQGRPVISVLPAPTLSSIVKYSHNFNRALDGSEYDKERYDHLDDPADFLGASAEAMSNEESGASYYYSANNPNKDNGFNRFIPDAQGYPFTETAYTQDNTGRISRQSGVGPTYKLGSNHETKYYYGTAAQKELDALFGTEVGNETHYFKNMVRDANGQYAVTYLDMHGRTIATALAGQPDSATLAALPSDVPFTVTDTLSGPGKNTIKDLVMESVKGLLVPVPGPYEFSYELTPPVLQKEGCTSTVCYNALYDLEITITDDSYNRLLGGEPFTRTVHIPGTFTADCGIPPQPVTVNFTLDLPQGSYTVTKRLSISGEGLEYYRDNVFVEANLCKTLDDFIQEQRQLLLNEQCAPTCQSCMDSLGTWNDFRNNYMSRAGIMEDTASYRGEAWAAFQAAAADCNALCNNESETEEKRKALLLDVTAPSGQYAKPDESQHEYSIFYQPSSTATPIYKRDDITYLDEAGNPDLVYNQFTDAYVKPQTLSPDQFAAAFKDSWAEALLPFHPEYCKLVEFGKHDASNKWDRDFQSTDTYAEARAKGYLNPTARTDGPFASFPTGTAPADPLSMESAALKAELEGKLLNFKEGWIGNSKVAYSLWTTATITVKCGEDNPACVNSYLSPAEAFNESKLCAGDLDMAWRSFRELYLQTKRDIIHRLVTNAACPNGPGAPSADRLIAAGKHPNFNSAADALTQNGLDYLNNMTTEQQGKDKGNELLNQTYESNCRAYVSLWMKQLSPCTYYDANALDEITEQLVAVCREGSDINHTTGSSTVRPESTYGYRSFQQVINEYNAQHGINDAVNCNAELITAPKPYDKQPAYGSKTTYTKPDECECTKLNVLHNEFQVQRTAADSNFSAYLLRTRKVKILESSLEELLDACNNSLASCTYLAEPLLVPAFMQCYTGPACATCAVVDSLYTAFTNAYPGIEIIPAEADTLQQKKNRLFANFMNNRLGFAKEAWEYLSFRDSCGNVTSRDTVVCQSARQLVKMYSSGGSDDMRDIQKTADNGYLLAGSTTPGSGGASRVSASAVGMGGKEAYIIKTDSKGAFLWAKIYGGSGDDEFYKLKPTTDGGYIALGMTKSFQHSTGDIFIVKMDAEGNVSWSRAIGFGTTYGEWGQDIVQTHDGGYAFTGLYNYDAGVSDWLVGTLTVDGTLSWIKRMGTHRSEANTYLLADNDTLVISGTTYNGLNTYFNGALLKINRSTGALLNAAEYDIEGNGTTGKSNWFGPIFKTAAGYKITVIETDDFYATNGNGVILDLRNNGDVIAARALGQPPGAIDWISITPTSDSGVIASQIWHTAPTDVYLHKISADDTITWSNQLVMDGNEQVSQLLENPDGSFAGVGMHNNQAMLVLPLASGKTGCQDSAIDVSYTTLSTVKLAFEPTVNNFLSNPDINISPAVQTWYATEANLACNGFDSCYTVNNGPLLCGNVEEVFAPAFLDSIDNCTDNDFFAISTGTILYNAYRDSIMGSFEQDYINTCLQAADLESFTVNYSTREYHYTLYYYDQAGNLVKTVPPAGVVVDRSDTWLNQVKTARAAGERLVPAHTLVTGYRYNTLNQVIAQRTPDAGVSHFWYDRLGRLAVSQNAKQAADNAYSYTLYDPLGRITEVGEISSGTAMTDAISRNDGALSGWISNAADAKTQITRAVYDLPHSPIEGLLWNATNLRNRVSWTAVYNTAADLASGTDRASATFYSYDIHGNVKTLLQDFNSGAANNVANRFKKIRYDYDLISGKVNMVSYQPGEKDAFYHRYSYDAENRLTNAETSPDSVYWENDAYYQYYRHGPLARTVLGQQQVQGLDYAYTLQGWLKGVNSTTLTPGFDMGQDGAAGGITARDAFGFALHYYGERDYKPVNASVQPFAGAESTAFKPLFNGNIGAMSVNLPKAGEPLLYNYGYDVLNRLVTMNTVHNLSTTDNTWSPVEVPDFAESISYDPNGNILTYNRNGNNTWAGKPTIMDQLTYNYIPGTNKLDAISEPAANDGNYDNDIDGQASGNYGYDAIGNLTKDAAAGIPAGGIEWTVYGKIKSITKTGGPTIQYTYDAAGNRISKMVDGVETRYIRDASGNVMSVYVAGDNAINSGALSQTEVHLYGSSRLGITKRITNVEDTSSAPGIDMGALGTGKIVTLTRGNKFFELGNHLGNVLATVSDSKKAVSEDGSTVDHYEANVVSAQDYYPFGMLEPGRSYASGGYRYGFNGKENDNETGWQDYGMRIYDRRGGRFLSVDPMAKKFPEESPYGFAGNSPISYVDYNGMFKISPFFAKRYPTLAKVIKYYLPLLKDNPGIRDAWIKTSGYKDLEAGGRAFDEMVTYGKGPWISPTRDESEAKTDNMPLLNKIFYGQGGGEYDENSFPDNLIIGHGQIEDLETAVRKGDEDAIAEAMFIVTSAIMHESAHYGRSKLGVLPDNDFTNEAGAQFEFFAFGERFSYKRPNIADARLQRRDIDAMKSWLKKNKVKPATFGMSIKRTFYNYYGMVKDAPVPKGQKGDVTVTKNNDDE